MADQPKIPLLPGDPRNREELDQWRERRAKKAPDVPLSPREYLMIQQLGRRRPPYSIT